MVEIISGSLKIKFGIRSFIKTTRKLQVDKTEYLSPYVCEYLSTVANRHIFSYETGVATAVPKVLV